MSSDSEPVESITQPDTPERSPSSLRRSHPASQSSLRPGSPPPSPQPRSLSPQPESSSHASPSSDTTYNTGSPKHPIPPTPPPPHSPVSPIYFIVNVQSKIVTILRKRRSIIFYCTGFIVLQLILMAFYQHQATHANDPDAFALKPKYRRGMVTELETFVHNRKDKHTNSTTVLFADSKNREWVQNFLYELKKVNMPNYVIFAMEKQVCAAVDRQGCYVLQMGGHTALKSYKYFVWELLLGMGVHVFAVDPDVVLFENPILYFDHTVDLNIMSESPSITSKWATELERVGLCCTGHEKYYNAGFFYLKSTPASLRLLEEMKQFEHIPMQESLNMALAQVPDLKVNGLDRDMFPNGFVGFMASSPQRKNFDTIAYKLDWSDPVGKLSRARELLCWHLDPIERYSQPRKYITYSTENDFVTLQVEQDFLSLTYFLGKILGRSLILPKFHSYVGEPPKSYIDALFDASLTEGHDVFEHSFLQNPQVPHENLRRKKLPLRRVPSVLELVDYLEKASNTPLIEIIFPKIEANGAHLSLDMLEDRTSANVADSLSIVERVVRLNANGLFSPKYTIDRMEGKRYTCAVTAPFKINPLIDKIKEAGHDLVYVITHEPTLPTHKEMRKMLESKINNLVLGYESMWTGHKLLTHHSAPIHIQMTTCADADHVVINSWEPYWMIGGICDLRRALGKPECEFTGQDPWLP